ncbi:hypothetical protein MIR68_010893 [Amoeboaphelidium protococcarum]|nr:hypothetical protein MIR68_010893 [Amoeboaphelidium protococcarum]
MRESRCSTLPVVDGIDFSRVFLTTTIARINKSNPLPTVILKKLHPPLLVIIDKQKRRNLRLHILRHQLEACFI